MTEKRFTLHPFGLNFIIRDNGKELTAKQIVDLLNENEQLKQRNERQYNQLTELWGLIENKDWETLTVMNDKMIDDEEKLQEEWRSYYD